MEQGGKKVRREKRNWRYAGGKRAGSLLLALFFALLSVLPAGLLTAGAAGGSPGGWSGDYTADGDAIVVGSAGSKNNFVVSDACAAAFSYEADMFYQSGTAGAGLLFGVGDKSDPASSWGGVHINGHQVRLFFEQDRGALDKSVEIPGGVGAKIHLKLTVDRYKNFSVFVNDMNSPLICVNYAAFQGGYVGAMTFDSSIRLENILFEDWSASRPSGLANFKGGSFSEADGTITLENLGQNNNLVVSDTRAGAFVFQADMKITGDLTNAQAGFLFGVQDRDDPAGSNKWSTMKLWNNKLWAFNIADYTDTENGLLVNMEIPGFTASGDTVRIKLAADGEGNLEFYVGDMDTPVHTAHYPNDRAGYVGFSTWDAKAEFSNITFVDNTPPAESVLGDYKGGSFTQTGSTVKLHQTSGDNVAVSETYAKSFVFEADMTVDSSTGEAGLLFGVENRDNPGNKWCCMKVRRQGLWAFNLSDYQEAEGLLIDMAIPGFTFQGTNHLKLTADGEGNLEFFVGDMETPVTTKSYPRYKGGYLGFTSINTEATFTNIKFTDTSDQVFNTNLSGWEARNSTWYVQDNGCQGMASSGDGFYTAAESVEGDFTLQADVTVESGTALGLTFRVQGADAARDGSYVVNCDMDAQCFKFFRFPGYAMSTIAVKNFSEAGFVPERGKTYPMKLSVKDNHVSMYFDGHLIFDGIPDVNTEDFYTGGRVGIMACGAVARFQNVYLRTGSSDNALTGFTLEPHTHAMTQGNQLYYLVPESSDKTRLAPTFKIPDTAKVDKASGSIQDFTNPVTYTVTAANGDEALYTVTVYSQSDVTQGDRDLAGAVSERIAALPAALAASDKDTVTALQADYEKLSPLQKLLVEGRDKLAAAVKRAEDLTRPLRITCVGDSITQGVGSSNEGRFSYPAQLQKLLGDGYEVKNAGVSGSNVTKGLGYPYWTTSRYREGKAFMPDIAIIMIGTNDALNNFVWDPNSPENSNALFKRDYITLIEEYEALPSHPKIFIVLPMVSYQTEGRQENLVNYIMPTLREIAADKGMEVIDMNAFTTGHADWFPDGLHPNDGAYEIIAGEFAGYIRGFASAQLSSISLDGKPLEGFSAAKDSYDIVLPKGAGIPVVTAAASDNDAVVSVSDPGTTLPGAVTITVTSGDGRSRAVYTLHFSAQKQTVAEAHAAAGEVLAGYRAGNDTTADDILSLVQGVIENEEIAAVWSTPFAMKPADQNQDGAVTGVITLSCDGEDAMDLVIALTIPKLGGGTEPPQTAKPGKPSIPGGSGGFQWPDLSGGEGTSAGKTNPPSGDHSQAAVALVLLAASAALVIGMRGKK